MQDLVAQIKYARKPKHHLAKPEGSSPASMPLVGRLAEWQAIQALWKTVLARNPRMLLICGEAGIGKSRLAEELVQWASRQGMYTAVAHCYSSEGSLPYAPIVTWLRASPLPPLDKVWVVELSRLLPELLKDRSNPPAPLTEAWQRSRLFEALARAILGSRQKTLLLVEDLQWCDHDTIEWLHYLLRFDVHSRLLVVGTLRSEEAQANPAIPQLRSVLQQEGFSLEIELGPLNEAETGQLATYAAGKPLERGMGALIYQETEGNPLFIVETVRSEVYKPARLPGVQPLPYKARAVLENRVRQLSPPTHAIVLLAATIGRAFPMETLLQASGTGEAELVTSLDELLQRRIVREIAPGTFDFTHDKLRQAVFTGVSGAHRQLLHRQVAETLLCLSKDDLENKSGEIASHYEQAGNDPAAVHYYRQAAESARKIFANERAIQYFQRALALCEAHSQDSADPVFSPAQIAQLFEELGETLALAGKYPQAQVAYEQALAQPFSAPGLWRAQIYRNISDILDLQYQHPQAHAALDQAERALNLPDGAGTLPERQEWIQIQLVRSQLFYWDSRPDLMDALIQKIRPMVEVDGRLDQQIELFSQQYEARMRHERYRLSDETLALVRRKLELVEMLHDPISFAWAQFTMGFALLWHGEPAAAREWLAKGLEAAVQMGAGLLQVRCLNYLGIASRKLGDLDSLREQTQPLLDLTIAMGEHAYHGYGLANQGWLAWRDGDLVNAERLCTSAIAIWNQSGGLGFHWLAEWVLLAIAVSQRDLGQAECHARALLDPAPIYQPVEEVIAARLTEALCACQAQDAETAFQIFNQSLELARASGDL
jgi:tetratricopeptide (TPR) repeat protein